MEHLIPPDWFENSPSALLFLITIISMAFLIKGADWLVEGASGLAHRLGMPKVIIGATIVSLGTTSPECAVSVMAAWGGNAGLALGNAVGSIIADSALIFGVGCLLVKLPADRFVLNRQGWVQFCSALLLAGICYLFWFSHGDAASIGRAVGVGFLVLLVGYMALSIRWARQHSTGEMSGDDSQAVVIPHSGVLLTVLVIVGLVVVIFSSHVLISSVIVIAVRFSIPNDVIAATLVAFGTSLPELVVGIVAIRKKHPELLVGNVIGADILNVLFVIGAAAAAKPLPIINMDEGARVPELFLYLHLPVMLLVMVLFRLFIFRAVGRGYFSRWMGVPLLIIYVSYVVLQYVVTRV